jgi:cell division protein FtsQ
MPSGTTERPETDASTRRSRRAFARRQWARRWLTWKYVLAAVVLLGLVVGAIWLFLFSSVLAVKQVDVQGTKGLRPAEVRAVAGLDEGEPLARVDLDDVRTRVQALALVRSAEVTRKWPDTVVIEVEERVAIATVEIGNQLRGLDLDGVVFGNYAKPPAGLPRVETFADAGREALREAAAVVSALPEDLAARVDHVEVATVDQISLVLRDERVVVWGSAEESDVKAEVLAGLLETPASAYDVSVPGQPTIRP